MRTPLLHGIKLATVAVATGFLSVAAAYPSSIYRPDPSFLQGINTDLTASWGLLGTINDITFTPNSVRYDVTFGPTDSFVLGPDSVAVGRFFPGPYLELPGYSGIAVNVRVLEGQATTQLFVQAPSFEWQASLIAYQTPADGVLILEHDFQSPGFGPPVDPSALIWLGFKIHGPADTRAIIEISSASAVPDGCGTLALFGFATAGLALARRRN